MRQFLLGLGSNLGDRLTLLRMAVQLIELQPKIKLLKVSPIYTSSAQLKAGAPKEWNQPFLNLALIVETSLAPMELLKVTQQVEFLLGRLKEHEEWSPRTIDIDILVARDAKTINNPKLILPHPRFLERPFALLPASDIAPDWLAPNSTMTLASFAKSKWMNLRKVPFKTKRTTLKAAEPYLMGIVNLTAESFSDGTLDLNKALRLAIKLYNDGAEIIDVGAEATNPRALPLDPEAEWDRLEPFLYNWERVFEDPLRRPKLSVDTYHPETLLKLECFPYIDYFNLVLDTISMDDKLWLELSKKSKAKFIFTHNLALPNRSKCLALDEDPVSAVIVWAKEILERARRLKIDLNRIIIDPGIGFSKYNTQDWEILRRLKSFEVLNMPILIGHSRKSFLNPLAPLAERDALTAQLSAYLATQKNVHIIRVHNVKASRQALELNNLLS